MLIARQVFHAKYGRGDELVALFKELNSTVRDAGGEAPRFRILTDASGPFFTVVTEIEVESFAAWEQTFGRMMGEVMSLPAMQGWFSRMTEVVDSGRRDFYTVVE